MSADISQIIRIALDEFFQRQLIVRDIEQKAASR